MGYMRIKCHYCGGTWEVYGRSVTNGDYARTCPHCFKANRELVKDSSGYHTPLFEVSYEADSVFRNGYENCPNLD